MTCVSSEWRRFPSLQTPDPSAARTRARFEIDLDPGVASLKFVLVGGPGKTWSAGERTRAITLSSTPVARSSAVLPMRERRTTFLTFPAFFLSTRMMSSSVSTLIPADLADLTKTGSPILVGRPCALRQRARRPTAAFPSFPRLLATSASRTIPTLTHSPCKTSGVTIASMAWPIVWPKLTRLRRPVSFSSMVTMYDLVAMEARMTERRRDWAAERVSKVRPA